MVDVQVFAMASEDAAAERHASRHAARGRQMRARDVAHTMPIVAAYTRAKGCQRQATVADLLVRQRL
jgi:hypothetical protein